MINRVLKATTGKLPIKFPTSLSEITLGQMIDLQEEDLSDIKVISILSGVAENEIANICVYADLGQFHEYVQSLNHQMKYPKPFKMPAVCHIDGIAYQVPKDIAVEPVGAFMNCRNIIVDEINAHIKMYGETDWKNNYTPTMKSCLKVLSEYFYTRITKLPYSEFEVSGIESKIRTMPLTEAFPLARFFFLNYPDLLRPKIGFWKSLKIYWHTKRASRRLKRSGITTS